MTKSYFFVGIGGSGMLPLAEIVAAQGCTVAGSDRSLDQGRLGAKFGALAQQGIGLHAQDGSGIVSGDQIVVASAAVEAIVPDIIRATELGCTRMTRAELLAELFNAAPVSIGVGGTSGKSTVTGMIGWILDQTGHDPTIMNGAVMKNYDSGSRVGSGPKSKSVFVSEVDESDGSIALYRPTIAVLHNISHDHKSMAELRYLFSSFLSTAKSVAVNVDDVEARALPPLTAWTYGQRAGARLRAVDVELLPEGSRFSVNGMACNLALPGMHNVSNALAALAATRLADVPLGEAVAALATFTGIKRRMETVGSANGITVIDDFGHNPDKIAATLSALHAFPGRLLIYFQPHGYGPLKQMARELADSFIANMHADDRLLVSDPAYFGGTVDRSVGADALVNMIGAQAEHVAAREDCGARLVDLAQPGDRIIVMGARDDTLSIFAQSLLAGLG
jgi:UDP-N-acetylmuramate--alanine ligase